MIFYHHTQEQAQTCKDGEPAASIFKVSKIKKKRMAQAGLWTNHREPKPKKGKMFLMREN